MAVQRCCSVVGGLALKDLATAHYSVVMYIIVLFLLATNLKLVYCVSNNVLYLHTNTKTQLGVWPSVVNCQSTTLNLLTALIEDILILRCSY